MAAKRTKRSPSGRAKLFALEDANVAMTQAMLFEGNALGGRSLTELLDKYREAGPYSSARSALIKHLHLVLEQMITMEATIVSRCHLDPHRKLPMKIKHLLQSVKD